MARTLHALGLLVVPTMPDQARRIRHSATYDSRDSGFHRRYSHAKRHWFGYQNCSMSDEVVAHGTALIPYRTRPPMNTPLQPPDVRLHDAPLPRSKAYAFEVVAEPRRDVSLFAHETDAVLRCRTIQACNDPPEPPTYHGPSGESRAALREFCAASARDILW